MKISKKRLKEIIKEEIKYLNEFNLDSVRLPSQVKRFTDRLIQQIQRVNLTRPRKYAIVARIIDALGIEVNRLSQVMNIIKRDMRKEKD